MSDTNAMAPPEPDDVPADGAETVLTHDPRPIGDTARNERCLPAPDPSEGE